MWTGGYWWRKCVINYIMRRYAHNRKWFWQFGLSEHAQKLSNAIPNLVPRARAHLRSAGSKCHGLASLGLTKRNPASGNEIISQVVASSTQFAKNPFQCSLARAPVLKKTVRVLKYALKRLLSNHWRRGSTLETSGFLRTFFSAYFNETFTFIRL